MTWNVTLLERVVADTSRIVGGLSTDDLALASPCEGWTVRELVNHLVDTTQAFATALAGGIGELHQPAPDVVGSDPGAAYNDAAERMLAGWRSAPDSAVLQLSIGQIPLAMARYVTTADTLVHSWDILKATGRSQQLDPEAAEYVLEQARQYLKPEFRGPGRAFGLEVPCPEDAPIVDRVVAFFGRQP